MTPQEAVDALVAHGILTPNKYRTAEPLTLGLFKAVQETETWRCAARVKETISAALDERMGKLVADDLLLTGGLEVDE